MTAAELLTALDDGLERIYLLAGWHADDQADPENKSPEDQTSHVNGLIRQEVTNLQILILEEKP